VMLQGCDFGHLSVIADKVDGGPDADCHLHHLQS